MKGTRAELEPVRLATICGSRDMDAMCQEPIRHRLEGGEEVIVTSLPLDID